MRLFCLAVLCCVLAACAGRPNGVLTPVGQAYPGASRVDMLIATTRAPSPDQGVMFSGLRSRDISLTELVVSIPPDSSREVGQVQWPRQLPADPSREFATLSATPLTGAAAARGWLKANLPPKRRVLVFVHGFNNRFEDAVYRFAQIVHDAKTDVAPVLFTWPSRGRVFDYLYDRESTIVSRDALEQTLQQLARDPGVGEITVMAHSMGAWLLMESLRQMSIRDGRINRKIQNVILAAPDIDVDVFESQWRSLGKPRPNTVLFVSQRDHALRLSRRLAGNVSRLGLVDPAAEPYRARLDGSGIQVIDLTDKDSADRLNHGTFAENPEVVRLIGSRLIAGQNVGDAETTLGDAIGGFTMGLGQAVGSAAGLALTAPIAVLDPASRRSYGGRVEQFERIVEGTGDQR